MQNGDYAYGASAATSRHPPTQPPPSTSTSDPAKSEGWGAPPPPPPPSGFEQSQPQPGPSQQNATAGPSSLFLPPPPPPNPHARPPHLTSTQDLLVRLRLVPAYDKYVRPGSKTYGPNGVLLSSPSLNATGNPNAMEGITATSPVVDKGKGKEKEMLVPPTSPAGAGGDDDDEDGEKGKKKNSYRFLVRSLPGKHSMKKDNYLQELIQAPPKERAKIAQFDARTMRDAFVVGLEGLKGWNINALVQESAQAREDRKRRKELKRKARLGGGTVSVAPATPISAIPPSQPGGPSSMAGGVSAGASMAGTPKAGTPKVGTPKPTATGTPKPAPQCSRPATPVGTPAATPRPPTTTAASTPRPGTSSTVPRPGSSQRPEKAPVIPMPGSSKSTTPRPGLAHANTTPVPAKPPTTSAVPTPQHHPLPMRPGMQHSATTAAAPGGGTGVPLPRGKKREREEGAAAGVNGSATKGVNGYGAGVNGANGQGQQQQNPPSQQPQQQQPAKAIVGARAGVEGARPRPVKKQRKDMQGHARDVTAPVQ